MSITENCVTLYCSNPCHGKKKLKPRYYLANALFDIEETPITYEQVEYLNADGELAMPYDDVVREYKDERNFTLFKGGLECVLVPFIPDSAQPPRWRLEHINTERLSTLSPQAQKYVKTVVTPTKGMHNAITLTITARGAKPATEQTQELFTSLEFLNNFLNNFPDSIFNDRFNYPEETEMYGENLPHNYNDDLNGLTFSFSPNENSYGLFRRIHLIKPASDVKICGFNSPVLFMRQNENTPRNNTYIFGQLDSSPELTEVYELDVTSRLVTFHCPYQHNHRPLRVEDIVQAVTVARDAGITELDIASLEKYCV